MNEDYLWEGPLPFDPHSEDGDSDTNTEGKIRCTCGEDTDFQCRKYVIPNQYGLESVYDPTCFNDVQGAMCKMRLKPSSGVITQQWRPLQYGNDQNQQLALQSLLNKEEVSQQVKSRVRKAEEAATEERESGEKSNCLTLCSI